MKKFVRYNAVSLYRGSFLIFFTILSEVHCNSSLSKVYCIWRVKKMTASITSRNEHSQNSTKFPNFIVSLNAGHTTGLKILTGRHYSLWSGGSERGDQRMSAE